MKQQGTDKAVDILWREFLSSIKNHAKAFAIFFGLQIKADFHSFYVFICQAV